MKMKLPAEGCLSPSTMYLSRSADVKLDAHIRNMSGKSFSGKVEYQLFNTSQKLVAQAEKTFSVSKGKGRQTSLVLHVNQPELWEPDSPTLYQLHVMIKDKAGNIIDGYRRRIGIRSIEFKGKRRFLAEWKTLPLPINWRQQTSGFCHHR